jgi:hypothetical protein
MKSPTGNQTPWTFQYHIETSLDKLTKINIRDNHDGPALAKYYELIGWGLACCPCQILKNISLSNIIKVSMLEKNRYTERKKRGAPAEWMSMSVAGVVLVCYIVVLIS